MTRARAATADGSPGRSQWLFDGLDLRLQGAVEQFRGRVAEGPSADGLHGLYISDAEVDGLLGSASEASGAPLVPVARVGQVAARLPRLAQAFALDTLDLEVLLICLAPELDLRYERLYGYLQDDMTRRRPTIDLALRLLNRDSADIRRALGPGGVLARRGLLIGSGGGEPAEPTSFLSTTLRVDPRIAEYLLGADALDRGLEHWATLVEPPAPDAPLPAAHLPELQSLVACCSSRGDWETPGPIVYLQCGDAASGVLLARAWAGAVGARLLVVDFPTWHANLAGAAASEAFVALTREALLQDATLVLRGIDPLIDGRSEARFHIGPLRRALEDCPRLTFLIGETRWEPATCWTNRPSSSLELGPVSAATRERLWAGLLDTRFPPEAARELGARYRFVDETAMRAVAQGAIGRASLRGSHEVSMAEVLDVARVVGSPGLGGLARRIEPRHTWADIVLPPDALLRLRELCARFRHRATVYETWGYGYAGLARQGLAALFVGLPGTGKTMAAEIVAADLAYDLYRIDLSAVVSKYIGETEKNLESIFHAAEQGEVVLLFDEADALFGKRSEVRDAHDRYANVEVAYLLQRLETYAGVAILTSNLSGNLDEAFMRRLDALVEFPLPDENERREIWGRSLPPGAPRADDVDLADLARVFKLTGGHIRNSALTAAFLAASEGEPISRRHLVHAIRREYEKVGKLVTELDLGGAPTLR